MVRSSLTLVFLVAVVAASGWWGWTQLTEPIPEAEPPPVCEDTPIEAGTRVYPDQVTVSVYNASGRSGLAGRTLGLFEDRGFAPGQGGNAPRGTTVAYAQIWTSDPRNPAVKLARSYLGDRASVVEGEALGAGVVVVVGENFEELVRGRKSARSGRASTVCSPPGSLD